MTIVDRVVQLHRLVPGELEAHPLNWRKHPKRQLDALDGLLRSIGFAGALLAYRTGEGKLRLIDGHARQRLVDVPVPVLETDLTEEEANTLLALLDPISALATADRDKLGELLAVSQSNDPNVIALLERMAKDHDLVLTDATTDTSQQIAEAEALLAKWQVLPGDVWRIASARGHEHRIICGDSTDPATLQRLMGDERAVCLWTDPPYGVNYVGKTDDQMTIQNDTPEGLEPLLTGAFAAADSVLVPGAAVYVAHPAGLLSMTFMQRFLAQGWRFHQALVWVKDSMVLGHQDYHYQHEPILYGYTAGGGRRGRGGGDGWYGTNSETSVLNFPRPKASKWHPTMKPPELIAYCVQNSAGPGGIVLDIFNGSGSTLLACEMTGRAGRGVELEPKFCAVTLERLALMGLKPERVGDGAAD